MMIQKIFKSACSACILLSMLPLSVHAQFVSSISKSGTTAAAFLEIGVGARAVAMGGAFVGIADDATASYWNVAGLGRLKKGEVTAMHADWFVDTNFDYVAAALPVSRGTVAVHFTSFLIGDEPVRTVEQPEGTGAIFNGGSVSMGAAFAWNLTDRFTVGFNGKFIRETISSSTASAVAIDFGTIFVTPLNGMRLGATVVNFGPKMKIAGRDPAVVFDPDPTRAGNNDKVPAQLETGAFDLPLNFRVGVAMEVFEVENNRLTLALDANNPNNNTASMNFGGEYAFAERLFLRGGLNTLFERDSETDVTFGAGIRQPFQGSIEFRFDYAYTGYGVLGNVHRIGAAIGF